MLFNQRTNVFKDFCTLIYINLIFVNELGRSVCVISTRVFVSGICQIMSAIAALAIAPPIRLALALPNGGLP